MVDGRKVQVVDVMNAELVEAIAPPVELRTAYDQLKPFERQFVDRYLASGDNPLNAVRDIISTEGLDPKKIAGTIRVRAYDLIRRPLVQAAIAEKLKKHGEQWDITTERVLAELAKIAYANIDDYFERGDDGSIKLDLSHGSVTRDQMAAIGEIKVETTTDPNGLKTEKITFKMHDKLGALEKAMKHLGLYAPDRVELRGVIAAVNPNDPVASRITADMTDDQAADHYAQFLLGN